MGSVDVEKLHPSCRNGGDCCTSPCGPVYIHEEGVNQPGTVDEAIQEELQAEEAKKVGKFRSLGRRIISSLA